jgi:hypothetical protein
VRVFENIVLKKIFVLMTNEVTTDGGNFITTSFVIFTPRQMLQFNQMGENDMGQACGMYWHEKNSTEYSNGISEGKRSLRKPIRQRITLKWILNKYPADHNGSVV